MTLYDNEKNSCETIGIYNDFDKSKEVAYNYFLDKRKAFSNFEISLKSLSIIPESNQNTISIPVFER